jgi:hypothetical protein
MGEHKIIGYITISNMAPQDVLLKQQSMRSRYEPRAMRIGNVSTQITAAGVERILFFMSGTVNLKALGRNNAYLGACIF